MRVEDFVTSLSERLKSEEEPKILDKEVKNIEATEEFGSETETVAVLEKIYDSTKVTNSIVIVQGVFVCFLCGFFLARLVYSKFLRN